MAIFVQTFNVKIHYTDINGSVEKNEPITLMIKADNEEEARVKAYAIAKNAYLTWGEGTEILKAKD